MGDAWTMNPFILPLIPESDAPGSSPMKGVSQGADLLAGQPGGQVIGRPPLGITRTRAGAGGLMSRKAMIRLLSSTTVAGICPATIPQDKQSGTTRS